MNIVFDLDGTLIDSSERLFRLFNELIPESTFSREEYWDLKRNKVNHRMILDEYFPQHDFESFNSKWLAMIELPEYLQLDRNYPDTLDTLEKLSRNNHLFLLTARQSKDRLREQLVDLSINRFFQAVFVTEARTTKKRMLLEAEGKCFNRSDNDYFVSDMGADISVGNELEYHTVAVTHGFMNKDRLNEYNPEKMVDTLGELVSIMGEI